MAADPNDLEVAAKLGELGAMIKGLSDRFDVSMTNLTRVTEDHKAQLHEVKHDGANNATAIAVIGANMKLHMDVLKTHMDTDERNQDRNEQSNTRTLAEIRQNREMAASAIGDAAERTEAALDNHKRDLTKKIDDIDATTKAATKELNATLTSLLAWKGTIIGGLAVVVFVFSFFGKAIGDLVSNTFHNVFH